MRWIALALCLLVAPAHAEDLLCDDRDAIVAQLRDSFGETLVAVGVIPAKPGRPSGLMSIYTNPEKGTWTVTITAPNESAPSGFASCVPATGEGFRLLLPPGHPS